MNQINLSAWISATSAIVTIVGSVFMAGVAWSRGRLEGHIKAIERLITEWRQEDSGRWSEFKTGLERRIERIEDRLNEKEQ